MSPRPTISRFVRRILKALPHRTQKKRRKPSGSSYDDAPSKQDEDPGQGLINRESSIYSPDLENRFETDSALLHFPIRRCCRPAPYPLPTFGDTESITSLFSRRRESRDTTMLLPPAIEEVLHRNEMTQHPAIRDNPPPFARYSAPEPHKKQISKRATLVHQERLAFEQKCLSLDEEREQLATQLENVTQELSDAHQQIDSAKEEIAAREETTDGLREKVERLTLGIDHTANCRGSTPAVLRDLQKEHAACVDREMLLEMRIETLLNCRRKSRSQLRRKIDELQSQVRGFQNLEDKVRTLQVDTATLRIQEEKIDNYLVQIRSQENRIERFEVRQKEDAEELEMVQTELFRVHQRLREAEKEVKRRDSALEIVMLNNRDLELDIYCLKQQNRGMPQVYRMGDDRWPSIYRVKSLKMLVQ